jgi:hypothetical protein
LSDISLAFKKVLLSLAELAANDNFEDALDALWVA